MKFKKTKKGFIGGPLVDFYAYMAFALIIIIFFIIFKLAAGNVQEKIVAKAEDIEINTILMNYLNTPIEIKDIGKEMTIADLIILVYETSGDPVPYAPSPYEPLLEEKTKTILNPAFKNIFCENSWSIVYSYKDSKTRGNIIWGSHNYLTGLNVDKKISIEECTKKGLSESKYLFNINCVSADIPSHTGTIKINLKYGSTNKQAEVIDQKLTC